MASAAAIILALIKAIPAAEAIFQSVLTAYATWKREQNLNDENAKNARNAQLIAAAGRMSDVYCATCPARNIGGQHGTTGTAPAVPSGR